MNELARINMSPDQCAEPLPVDGPAADALARWNAVRSLGLEYHVAELDALGYTVIPPEKVAPPAFTRRMIAGIARGISRRLGAPFEINSSDALANYGGLGNTQQYMLFEDRVFEEAVLNPTALTLAEYMLGRSMVLNSCHAFVKGPGTTDLGLHSDNVGVPPPFSPYATFVNCTWVLSDYSLANGALCFVPGSHRLARHPARGEGVSSRVAVEAPAGSLVVWHGNTWHGAFARTAPGNRISMVIAYCRPFVLPTERYREEITPEVLARNPPRFAELIGSRVSLYNFKEEGIDWERHEAAVEKTWWD